MESGFSAPCGAQNLESNPAASLPSKGRQPSGPSRNQALPRQHSSTKKNTRETSWHKQPQTHMVVAGADCRALALVACKTASLSLACEAASLACRVNVNSQV